MPTSVSNGADHDLVPPEWAKDFRVGEIFTVRGWVVKIAGHYRGEDGLPEGFAIVVEGPTKERIGGDRMAKTKKSKDKKKKGEMC